MYRNDNVKPQGEGGGGGGEWGVPGEVDSEGLPLGRDFDTYASPPGREFDMSTILEHPENLEMSNLSYDETYLVFPIFLDTTGERKVSKSVFRGGFIPVSTVLRKSIRNMGNGTLRVKI